MCSDLGIVPETAFEAALLNWLCNLPLPLLVALFLVLFFAVLGVIVAALYGLMIGPREWAHGRLDPIKGRAFDLNHAFMFGRDHNRKAAIRNYQYGARQLINEHGDWIRKYLYYLDEIS